MALVTYVAHDGTRQKAEVRSGDSVMQGAVSNLIDGIVAECGGISPAPPAIATSPLRGSIGLALLRRRKGRCWNPRPARPSPAVDSAVKLPSVMHWTVWLCTYRKHRSKRGK